MDADNKGAAVVANVPCCHSCMHVGIEIGLFLTGIWSLLIVICSFFDRIESVVSKLSATDYTGDTVSRKKRLSRSIASHVIQDSSTGSLDSSAGLVSGCVSDTGSSALEDASSQSGSTGAQLDRLAATDAEPRRPLSVKVSSPPSAAPKRRWAPRLWKRSRDVVRLTHGRRHCVTAVMGPPPSCAAPAAVAYNLFLSICTFRTTSRDLAPRQRH